MFIDLGLFSLIWDDFDWNFTMIIPYNDKHTYYIRDLVSDIMDKQHQKHSEYKFVPFKIWSSSFLDQDIIYRDYDWNNTFVKIKDYNQTLDRCHQTVGIAILNTSITIVFGFSILIFSNFIPTIYFGFFTGIAMLLAMISVLTLLPKLILVYKPFGDGAKPF